MGREGTEADSNGTLAWVKKKRTFFNHISQAAVGKAIIGEVKAKLSATVIL